ncbi:MAG: aspartate--tRNA ligase, partial [Pyrinomonadaceae bacterium]|nr:aspartate--tRNA ligase [Pyrinomonadaceae bacterium]
PEFTQLDVELSFASPEIVYRLVEGLFVRVFKLIGSTLEAPFQRMTYADALRRYGSDKPDLRFGMELQDLTGAFAGTTFAPFAAVIEGKGEIKGLVAPQGAQLSRKALDELQEVVKRYGANALAWIKVGDEISSSLLKVLGQETIERVASAAGAVKGDAVLIVAGKSKVVAASLGALRLEVARRENLIPENVHKPLWVTEFPMFEFHEDDGRYYAMHHPFTSPLDEDLELFKRAIEEGETHLLGQLRAKAYDTVVNGVEAAGGSIRIHQRDVQGIVFRALGVSPEKAKERFGFFLEALEYGTPPHGGIAAGIERLLMAMTGIENIRDLMAFPKTASAADLMIDAPGEVDAKQLEELKLKIVKD